MGAQYQDHRSGSQSLGQVEGGSALLLFWAQFFGRAREAGDEAYPHRKEAWPLGFPAAPRCFSLPPFPGKPVVSSGARQVTPMKMKEKCHIFKSKAPLSLLTLGPISEF